MMKRKMISAVLAAVMTVGMITGCGSSQATTENKADKADKLESQTSLSSTDYDFEKEYAYGDFNAHSRADEESIHLKTKISYSRILRTINLSTFLAVKETT